MPLLSSTHQLGRMPLPPGAVEKPASAGAGEPTAAAVSASLPSRACRRAWGRRLGSLLVLALCAAPLAAGVGSWTPLGPEGGAASAIAFDPVTPGTLYLAMEGGLFISRDGAASWSHAAGGLPPGPLLTAVDPVNPSHLYALLPDFATNTDNFFFSLDRGATWQAGASFGVVNPDIRDLEGDPHNPGTVYAASFTHGVFRSTDGGRSWSLRSSLAMVTSLAIDRAGTISAGTAGSLTSFLQSTDGGMTWTDRSGTLPRIGDQFGAVQVVVDPTSASTLYLDAYRILSEPGNLFKSTDGGRSWTALGRRGTPVAVAPDGTIYTGSSRSTDGGASWTDLTQPPLAFSDPIFGFAFDPSSPTTVYAMTFIEGVFASHDRGASWTPANHGLFGTTIASLAVDPVTPSIVYASTQGNGFFRARRSGLRWFSVDPFQTNFLHFLVDPTEPATLYVPFPLQKSTDRGATWQPLANPPCPLGVDSLAIAATSPPTLYLAGTAACPACNLLKSTSGGASWSCIETGSASPLQDIVVAPSRPSILYGSNDLEVWKSSDSGKHWSQLHGGLKGRSFLKVLAVDPGNPDVVFLRSDSSLLKTTNGGRRWLPVGLSLPRAPETLQIDPRNTLEAYAWVALTSGSILFRTTDGGLTWTSISDGLPFFEGPFAIDLAHPNTVFAGTGANGVQSWTAPGP